MFDDVDVAFVEQQAATYCFSVRPRDDIVAADVVVCVDNGGGGLKSSGKVNQLTKASHTNMQNHLEAVNSYSKPIRPFHALLYPQLTHQCYTIVL